MAYEIKMLDLIDIELESSFLVLARNMGIRTRVKTWGYLILGPDTEPILVDTGASHPEIMETLGMTGIVTKEMTLRRQLSRHGVKINDVRWILHTHHHIDHAGQDSQFSMRQTVVTNRRELEYSASGIQGGQYPAEYVSGARLRATVDREPGHIEATGARSDQEGAQQRHLPPADPRLPGPRRAWANRLAARGRLRARARACRRAPDDGRDAKDGPWPGGVPPATGPLTRPAQSASARPNTLGSMTAIASGCSTCLCSKQANLPGRCRRRRSCRDGDRSGPVYRRARSIDDASLRLR